MFLCALSFIVVSTRAADGESGQNGPRMVPTGAFTAVPESVKTPPPTVVPTPNATAHASAQIDTLNTPLMRTARCRKTALPGSVNGTRRLPPEA